MKTNMRMVGTALLACLVVTGCANNRELITKSAPTAQNTVFTESTVWVGQPEKAIVDINFSVKSNSWRFAEIYNKHSNPPYRVHLNIGGQTTILAAEPVLEDKSPIHTRTPESGTGWKYQFSKRIALAPGKHKLTIALPADDVIVEREVELRKGLNTIELAPVYSKRDLRPYKGGMTFTAGVRTLDVIVN